MSWKLKLGLVMYGVTHSVIIALQGQIRWLQKEKRYDLWEIRALSCKALQQFKYSETSQ